MPLPCPERAGRRRGAARRTRIGALRGSALFAFVLIVALTGAACGSGGDADPTAAVDEPQTEQDDAGDAAGGAPVGRAAERAVGAPVRIPRIEQNGLPPSAIKAFLDEQMTEPLCQGSRCVTFAYVDQRGRPIGPDDPGFESEDPTERTCGWSPRLTPGGGAAREVTPPAVVTLGFSCEEGSATGDGGGGDTGGNGETTTTEDTTGEGSG